MATKAVRFDFLCSKSKLTFTHSLPAALVVSPSQQNGDYMQRFISAISPIMEEHMSACRANSAPTCQACSKPQAKVLTTPMSWLHILENPFINVWVNPVCEKRECELKIRQEIQDMMRLMDEAKTDSEATATETVSSTKEIIACQVCGKIDQAQRCSRCKTVAYCGKDHQKEDWAHHKKACAKLAKQNNVR